MYHFLLVLFSGLPDALLFRRRLALGRGADLANLGVQLTQARLNIAQTARGIGARRLRILNSFLYRSCAIAEGLRQFRFQRYIKTAATPPKFRRMDSQKRSVRAQAQLASPLLCGVRRLLRGLGQNFADTGIAIAAALCSAAALRWLGFLLRSDLRLESCAAAEGAKHQASRNRIAAQRPEIDASCRTA